MESDFKAWSEHSPEMLALRSVEELYHFQKDFLHDLKGDAAKIELHDDPIKNLRQRLPLILKRMQYDRVRPFLTTSAVLQGYCVFEHVMQTLGFWADPTVNNKLPYNLEESMKRIKSKTSLSFSGQVWDDIEVVRNVRNWIAHDGGLLHYEHESSYLVLSDAQRDRRELMLDLFSSGAISVSSPQNEPYDKPVLPDIVMISDGFVENSFKCYWAAIKEIYVVLEKERQNDAF